MGEVKYSINGKYFKDYGIYVSDSQGIMDALVRKPTKSYNWHEYHGESVDLNKPKFEAREISLSCFIDGENYEQMFLSFQNFIIEEFQKSGTQRLMIEPFGYKPLVYEVYMKEGVKLDKTFKDGRMVGIFEIKLIEPNPIKKVLYTTSDTLNLSYNSSKETEIFFVNGEKTTAKGNVSLSGKTLAKRVVSGYNFNGRNLVLNSKKIPVESGNPYNNILQLQAGGFQITDGIEYNKFETSIIPNGQLTLSFEIHRIEGVGDGRNIRFYNGSAYEEIPNTSVIDGEKIVTHAFNNTGSINGFYMTFLTGRLEISWLKLEKGNKATDLTPAPEDEKYIIIAGNVDEITDLTTNAEVLWEKL